MSEREGDSQQEPPSQSQSASKDATGTGHKEKSSSLASRIQKSASTLVRGAITRPGGHAMGTDLAQSQTLGNGSKAGSSRQQLSGSSSAASVAMESLSLSRSNGTGAGSAAPNGVGVGSSAPESFRSSMQVQGGFALDAMGQDQFQSEYGDESLFWNSGLLQHQEKGKGKGKEREIEESTDFEFQPAWEAASAGKSTSTPHTAPQASSLQNAQDGAAVVALLSDPNFQPEFLPTADDPTDYSVIDTVAPLTAEELQIIDRFRRHQSSSAEDRAAERRITSRSLIPDIDGFLAQDASHAAMDTTTLRNTVLTNLAGAEDWMGVEERYHEEVWGYLRPALQAASKELEEKKNKPGKGSEEKDGPAVRRLKMILRHMQQ
ncbi:hypothetical protein VTN77DRAFT_5121 [Rasamsonia byssochlamydoides]|uniref:uncharacterized protein n=1 Tax=Rasamsonia byssochlamydoides TaxID=89139 RepID=UPI0037433940